MVPLTSIAAEGEYLVHLDHADYVLVYQLKIYTPAFEILLESLKRSPLCSAVTVPKHYHHILQILVKYWLST